MRRVSWNYDNTDDWGNLCAIGKEQSPIDIVDASSLSLAPPVFNYHHSSVSVEHRDYALRVNTRTAGNTMTFKDKTYEFKQFHFHQASEHLVDGTSYVMEMHLVHEDSAGNIAVVGVLLLAGSAEDSPIASIIEALLTSAPDMGDKTNGEHTLKHPIDLNLLLPKSRNLWTYQGSLTTPPCTEGVDWLIMCEPMTMPQQQLTVFMNAYPQNARPVQSLGKRNVYYVRSSK